MKGDRYIYRVSHMDDISNVKTFGSVVEVRKYTGLAEESVYSCFINNKHIKGCTALCQGPDHDLDRHP